MSEIDIDLAIQAIAQGVDDLLLAAGDEAARAQLAANRERLLGEMGRLSHGLGDLRLPGVAPGIVGLRLSAIAVPGRPPRMAPRAAAPLLAGPVARRSSKGGARPGAVAHAG